MSTLKRTPVRWGGFVRSLPNRFGVDGSSRIWERIARDRLTGRAGRRPPDALEREHGVHNVAYLSWYHRQFLESAQTGGGGESVAVQGTG